MANLFGYLDRNPLTVVLIQEPWWYKDKITGIPKSFRILGTQNSRAVIAAPAFLPLFLSNELTTQDCTVANLVIGNFTQYLASIYLDINYDAVNANLLKISHYFQNNSSKAILGIDSNAHSPLWGCASSNDRGLKIEEFVMEFNYEVLNRGNRPTFETSRASSIIDITLSFDSSNQVSGWKVRTDHWFSDHKCIEFYLKTNKIKLPTVRCINWSIFRDSLFVEEFDPDIWTPGTIEREAAALEKSINDALHISTFYKQFETKQAGWFSPDLQLMKSKVITLHRKMIRLSSVTARNDFLVASKEFKYACKRAKRKSWKSYCDSISEPKQMVALNRCLNKNAHVSLGLLKNPEGGFAKSPFQTLDILTKVHLPGCQPVEATNSTNGTNAQRCNSDVFVRSCNKRDLEKSFITEQAVLVALNSFGPNKIGGLDRYSPQVLQTFVENKTALKRLTRLYQAMIELSYNPKHWCSAKMVFIPKPKKDYSDPKGFRPISLMTFLIKTCEKLVHWEIEQTVLKDRPLSKQQYGFRKNFSCDTAISSLVQGIESLILRDKMALCVFLDVEGAFNNISYKSIIKAMYNRKIPVKIVKWYEDFLQNRTASVDYKGINHTVKILKGTAQGGILSALVWNLVYEEFISLFKTGPVKINAFADDSCLLLGGICQKVMVEVMQKALKKATDWGDLQGLNFVPSKTQAVFFHRKNKFKLPNKLKLKGVPIEYSEDTKYLGIQLDQKLSWKQHVNSKINSAKRAIMKIKSAIGVTFGPVPKMLSWAFKGIILPSLSYGSIAWSRVCQDGKISQKLNSLNRLIALCMAPIRKSTPTAGLQVLLNLPPLETKIKEISLSAMLRVLPHQTSGWDGVGKKGISHLKWGSNNLQELGISEWNFDSTNSLNLHKDYKVDIKSFKDGNDIHNSDIVVYTDGSKLEGNAGFGFAVYKDNNFIDSGNGFIGQNQTVFQAEVVGIKEACDRLQNYDAKSITILSDSQSAISAIAGWKVRSKTVASCIKALNLLSKGKEVIIRYIRAHVGFTGNERADTLAKQGTKNVQNTVRIPQPMSWAKMQIRNASYQEWCHKWYQTKVGRQTKIWFPSLNIKCSKILTGLPRLELGLVIQMITGHNRLNRHENLCNQDVSPTCRFCKEETETSWHIFGECPMLYTKRWQSFKSPFLDDPPEWKTYQFLDFLHRAKVSDLNKRDNLELTQV